MARSARFERPTVCAVTGRLAILAAVALVCAAAAGATSPGRNGRIAFSALLPGSVPGIVAIDPDGSGREHLTRRRNDGEPVPSPDGKLVAFVREGADRSIWVMRADGGGRRRLATGIAPAWSPDGRRIAFAAPRTAGSVVTVIGVGGSGYRELTRGDYPSWSPDGSRIAFYRLGFPASELRVIGADSSAETLVAEDVYAGGFEGAPRPPAWAPSGNELALVRVGLASTLVVVSVGDGSRRVLVRDTKRRLGQPSWSPDRRLIAFARTGAGAAATVHVVRIADRRVRELAANASTPVWSPNGRTIAIVTEDAGQLLVVSATGGRSRRVTHNEPGARIEGAAAWSRDGRRLLYAHTPGSDSELMAVRPDGGGLRQLTHNVVDDEQPAWSPDGARLAFARRRLPSYPELYVMKIDGAGLRRVARPASWVPEPAWSPDGRRIVFADRAGLAVMKADGTGRRMLVSDGASPDWSPDGRQIVFSRLLGLFVVNADGTGLRELVTGDEGHFPTDPAWSPDGERILFVRHNLCGGSCDLPSLVTIRPDGTDEQTIAPFAELEQPAWSPDGELIVAVGSGALHILRADGAPVRTIRPIAAEISGPAWQPVGR